MCDQPITTVEQLVEKIKDLLATSPAAAAIFHTDPGGAIDYYALLDGSPLSDPEKDAVAAEAFARMGW